MEHHRKSPSFDGNFGSTFSGEMPADLGAIANLSVGGCSIASKITLPPQSVAGLQIQLPDSRWSLEVEQAVVRWVRGTTFGLELQTLSDPDTARLQQLRCDLDQGPLVVTQRPVH